MIIRWHRGSRRVFTVNLNCGDTYTCLTCDRAVDRLRGESYMLGHTENHQLSLHGPEIQPLMPRHPPQGVSRLWISTVRLVEVAQSKSSKFQFKEHSSLTT